MKCTDAREVIQNMMDGENCPNAKLAHVHIAGCADCREWKSGMDAIMTAATEAIEEIPDIDISMAVMARLPKHHPASTSKKTVAWSIKRFLAWSAACWFAGAVLIVIGLGAWIIITGTSFASLPTLAYGSLKNMAASGIMITTGIIAAIKPFLSVMASALPWLKAHAIRITPLILFAVTFDIALLIGGYWLWLQKKTSNGLLSLI